MEYGVIGLIILILDIFAIISILGSGAPIGNKALWIILILVLPIIGLVLWWAFGRKAK